MLWIKEWKRRWRWRKKRWKRSWNRKWKRRLRLIFVFRTHRRSCSRNMQAEIEMLAHGRKLIWFLSFGLVAWGTWKLSSDTTTHDANQARTAAFGSHRSFLVLFVTGGAEPINPRRWTEKLFRRISIHDATDFSEPVEPQQRFLVVFFFVLVLDCLFRSTLFTSLLCTGYETRREADVYEGAT